MPATGLSRTGHGVGSGGQGPGEGRAGSLWSRGFRREGANAPAHLAPATTGCSGLCSCIRPALPRPWGGRAGSPVPMEKHVRPACSAAGSCLSSLPWEAGQGRPSSWLGSLHPALCPVRGTGPPHGHPDAPSSGTRAAVPAGAGSSGRVPVPGLVCSYEPQVPPGASPAGLLWPGAPGCWQSTR